ncbi:MAG: hypothetical protein RL347_587 [Actinomycetota bacterium]|jgi:hypothetical protein
MLPGSEAGPVPGFVALLRFRSDDVPALMARLRDSVALLAGLGGFVDARVGRAIDDDRLIVMEIGWRTVGDYRRALSSYDVKVNVVPLLSQAIDEPTAFEVLHVRDAAGAIDATGALAADASSVSLGSAAADFVPPAPS